MDYIKVLVTTIVAYAMLFVLCKIIGGKQISQMSMFDYITGITIGSIAAEMSTELEEPAKPLIAMTVFALITLVCAIVSSKSTALRKIITGRSLILMDNGTFFRENFKKAHIDISDFMTLARVNGYYDISQIQTAIMENNGTISFLATALERPLTPKDMNIAPEGQYSYTSLILDGHVMKGNLKKSGKEEKWLQKQLTSQGYKSCAEVFLALYGSDNSLAIYPIVNKKADCDRYE